MTHLVKFMRTSMTFARRSRGISWSKLGSEKSQQRCLFAALHCHGDYGYSNRSKASILLGASFAFLGFFEKEEEEEKEPVLITTIKRSILLIQKKEYKKAEQMLHIALRQAQSLQNEDGITYVYDVMANLSFEIGEFDKAEKLYKEVMQRLLSTGTPQNDLKIIHISLKLTKILEHRREYEKAEIGYNFCLKNMQEYVTKEPEEPNVLMIYAMTLDWYSHMLLTLSRNTEAMKFMEKAYELCLKINGETHEQTVVLLNDLGSISFLNGDYDDAISYLNKAAEIGKNLPDMEDLASIHINLGNVYIMKGILDEAKRSCTKGLKLSRSRKNNESLQEAKACLDNVKKLLTK